MPTKGINYKTCKMKNILFTTEFSEHAESVYRYALELARAFGSTITLGIPFGKPATSTDITSTDEKKERAIKRLKEFADKHTPDAFKDISLEFDAVHAYPGEGIIKLCENNSADLLVMSMTGSSAGSDQHFSDTTLNVLHKASVPVLAIPANATFNGLKRLVFSTDFQFKDIIALNMLRRWSEQFNSAIMTIHVLGRQDERAEDREKMEALQRAYASNSQMHFKLIPSGKTKEELLDYLEDNEAELLAMTTAKRSGLWSLLENSTTRKMARSVKIPLLVVKDQDDIN